MRFLLISLFCLTLGSLGKNAGAASMPGDPFNNARAAFETGRFDDALTSLNQADQRGATGESLDLRGTIFMEQGRLDDALKAFAAAHEKAPDLFSPRLHLGEAFYRQKKFAEARGIFQPLLSETNILISNEKLRYAILMSYLAEHDENSAHTTLDQIVFPTESPAYYYAQAAWEFSHGRNSDARKWLNTADQIFQARTTAWFARPLFDTGWLKKKPLLVAP